MTESELPGGFDPTAVLSSPDTEPEVTTVSGITFSLVGDVGASLPSLSNDLPPAMRKQAIRSALSITTGVEDRLNLLKGELLHEVSALGYWAEWTLMDPLTGETRPYNSFEEFIESELGIKKRTAQYWMALYRTFVLKLNLPQEVLKTLEWSKAIQLLPVITPDNATELLDLIGVMTVSQVSRMVRNLKSGGSSMTPADAAAAGSGTVGVVAAASGDTAPVVTGVSIVDTASGKEEFHKLVFNLTADQLSNVKAGLAAAQTMTGSDKPGAQLDFIFTDFLGGAVGVGTTGALLKLEAGIANLERAFSVKLRIDSADTDRLASLG
jgi:hypothetical protein